MKEWFPHDYYSTKDMSVVRLLMKHGARGYGIFWATIELLHSNNVVDACALHDVLQHMFKDVDALQAQQIVSDMVDIGLLHIAEDNTLYSRRVQANKEARDTIAETKRAAAAARWSNTKHKQSSSNTRAMPIQNTTIQKHNKVITSVAPPDAVFELPCTAERTFHVKQSEVDQMVDLYPSVDIFAELRKMKGWLIANATRRKTPKGMPRFVHAWLSKQQDAYNGSQQKHSSKVGERGSRLSTQQYDEQILAIAAGAAGAASTVHTQAAQLREAGTQD